jgi:predicted transcriptional regulator
LSIAFVFLDVPTRCSFPRSWSGHHPFSNKIASIKKREYTVYNSIIKANVMETAVLTLRINSLVKEKLDLLAEATHRSKSFLAAEAIDRYLETESWQIKEINLALQEADRGDFASDDDVAELVKKYAD